MRGYEYLDDLGEQLRTTWLGKSDDKSQGLTLEDEDAAEDEEDIRKNKEAFEEDGPPLRTESYEDFFREFSNERLETEGPTASPDSEVDTTSSSPEGRTGLEEGSLEGTPTDEEIEKELQEILDDIKSQKEKSKKLEKKGKKPRIRASMNFGKGGKGGGARSLRSGGQMIQMGGGRGGAYSAFLSALKPSRI